MIRMKGFGLARIVDRNCLMGIRWWAIAGFLSLLCSPSAAAIDMGSRAGILSLEICELREGCLDY